MSGTSVVETRLSSFGWVVVCVGTAATATGFALASVDLMTVGLGTMLSVVLARRLSRWNVRGISCQVNLPHRATIKEIFPLEVIFSNERSWLPAIGLTLVDMTHPRITRGMPHIRCIAPRASIRLEGDGSMSRRGHLVDFLFTVRTGFPLHLVESRIKGHSAVDLVVLPHPARVNLEPDARTGGERHTAGIVAATTAREGDFRSLREYRPGDPVKRIAWPASSRRPVPVLRELEHTWPTRARIVFHNHRPSRSIVHSRLFEMALEILTGVLHEVDARGWPALFWTDVADLPGYLAVEGHARDTIDRLIAEAQASGDHDLKQVIDMVDDPAAAGWLTIVVSGCPRRYWEPDVRQACPGPFLALSPREQVC